MAKNDFQYGWNSYTLQCGMWLCNDIIIIIIFICSDKNT